MFVGRRADEDVFIGLGRADEPALCVAHGLYAGLARIGVVGLDVAGDVGRGLRILIGGGAGHREVEAAAAGRILDDEIAVDQQGVGVSLDVEMFAVAAAMHERIAVLGAAGERLAIDLEGVLSFYVEDSVEAIAGGIAIGVVALAAEKNVVALAAGEGVDAAVADEEVGAGAAGEGVAAVSAEQEGVAVLGVGGVEGGGAGLNVQVPQNWKDGCDQGAFGGGEVRIDVGLEILVAFGIFECGNDVGPVELDSAAVDIGEECLVVAGAGLGFVVVLLHGEDDQGLAQVVERGIPLVAVAYRQAAFLDELPQVLGEAGDHGVGRHQGCTRCWIAYTGLMLN